jgi:hypothetical protein
VGPLRSVIHYHGTPITPRAVLHALGGRSFCVPFSDGRDVGIAHEIGQSVMLDNGAFSAWKRGYVPDWPAYYEWCEPWLDYATTWAVIPDVIDGDVADNDRLVREWPFDAHGAPVWHLHEPIDRLLDLASAWPRVCLGSSGDFARVGDARWHARMSEAMDLLCGDGAPPVWLHMLRGLDLAGSEYPFASADSTNVARNHAGSHVQRRRDARLLADEIDSRQCPARWRVRHEQLALAEGATG